RVELDRWAEDGLGLVLVVVEHRAAGDVGGLCEVVDGPTVVPRAEGQLDRALLETQRSGVPLRLPARHAHLGHRCMFALRSKRVQEPETSVTRAGRSGRCGYDRCKSWPRRGECRVTAFLVLGIAGMVVLALSLIAADFLDGVFDA